MNITYFITEKLINYQSEKSITFKLRKKRTEKLKQIITECYNKSGEVKIIDIGGTKDYWDIIPINFLIENKVNITVVNLPSGNLPENDGIFNFCSGDGCNLIEFANNSFHIAHSNSVIEHVGNDENRIKFSNEIKRVAKKYYQQTPNFWFPIEPHFLMPFFHWLPKPVRIWMLLHFDLGWYKKAKDKKQAKSYLDDSRLLTKKEFLSLFPESEIYKERFLFFVKSFVLIGNSPFTSNF